VNGQIQTQASLLPGKEPPLSIGWEARWAPEPMWTTWRRENSWPYLDSNSDPLAVQPVARRYTDCVLLASIIIIIIISTTIPGRAYCTVRTLGSNHTRRVDLYRCFPVLFFPANWVAGACAMSNVLNCFWSWIGQQELSVDTHTHIYSIYRYYIIILY
jgi:hypothetical protein